MNVEMIESKVKSSDGKNDLYYRVFVPETPFIGVLQVVHGMTEHIGRYWSFMKTMAEHGYLCFGHDHVGHGKTVPNDDDLGFIASKNGDRVLIDDVGVVYREVQSKYNFDKRFLLGHSMGSFITRMYASEHGDELNGYICMGTGGSNPAAKAGLTIAKALKRRYGERYISKAMYDIMFGAYNKKTENINGKEWLTKDVEIQNKYIADKYCMFYFTISAIIDLLVLLINSNSNKWYKDLKSDLPIYIVSGEDDPVGSYGKGPTSVAKKLKQTAHSDVTLRLWKNDRHEVLNELNKEDVIKEIIDWINSKN